MKLLLNNTVGAEIKKISKQNNEYLGFVQLMIEIPDEKELSKHPKIKKALGQFNYSFVGGEEKKEAISVLEGIFWQEGSAYLIVDTSAKELIKFLEAQGLNVKKVKKKSRTIKTQKSAI